MRCGQVDSGHSAMTSSSLSGRQQNHQQQLLYVVLPCIITLIIVVVTITVIVISLLRRRLRYIDKSSEQETVNLTSFGASQPPPISGLQLCAAQQHQLLLVSLSIAFTSSTQARIYVGAWEKCPQTSTLPPYVT